jgi:hypothetical protein
VAAVAAVPMQVIMDEVVDLEEVAECQAVLVQ